MSFELTVVPVADDHPPGDSSRRSMLYERRSPSYIEALENSTEMLYLLTPSRFSFPSPSLLVTLTTPPPPPSRQLISYYFSSFIRAPFRFCFFLSLHPLPYTTPRPKLVLVLLKHLYISSSKKLILIFLRFLRRSRSFCSARWVLPGTSRPLLANTKF